MSDVDRIGTDPAMAENSTKHNGKSGNFKDTYQATDAGHVIVKEDAPVVQILTSATKGVIATPDADKWWPRRMVEWVYSLVMSFADNTIKASVRNGDYNPDTTAQPYASLRAYKGRSLNGIWATAPYLHNGSVPTLVGSAASCRRAAKSFKVGVREFDPDKVGFKSEGYDGTQFNTTRSAATSTLGTIITVRPSAGCRTGKPATPVSKATIVAPPEASRADKRLHPDGTTAAGFNRVFAVAFSRATAFNGQEGAYGEGTA